ncbi:MAG TPA: NAD(P)/FAD-dependent oxidoreductase [Longimicrobiales bacterium]|nr:NAD(P)/FAD-dependent oxidoreductase [Longimicrobiales bacterium]
MVVGAGPNGLSAAIVLAQAGHSVLVREAAPVIGGGTRTEELTLPGHLSDVCSTIHPMAVASPFFRTLPLAQYGLEWVHTPTLLVHPFDDGSVVSLERTLDATVQALGRDGAAYRDLVEPYVDDWEKLFHDALRPIRIPSHPFFMAGFARDALRSVDAIARKHFREDSTRAMFAAVAGHCMLPLDWPVTASFGLMLCVAGHAVGWPLARGGSRSITDALAAHLKSLGGVIETDAEVRDVAELPPARAILFDVTPRQLLRIAGKRLTPRYRSQLESYSYGPGAFKIDWAVSEPVPWKNRRCSESPVLHLAGSYDEVLASERAPWDGVADAHPFVLFVQPSLFDHTRVPEGGHVVWAYCHVPNGSTVDRTAAIEAQVERFAPGFRDTIRARHVMAPTDLEAHNANLIGGDINGGAQHMRQLLFRPVARWNPYHAPTTSGPDLYLCSASTPPGGAVHGMCGFHAASAALRRL